MSNGYIIMDDGNAYTVDGVLIRKIHVPCLPKRMNVTALWNRFTHIGDVESVIIKKMCNEIYALITFVDSRDAAKALEMEMLDAEPADTWRQPPTFIIKDVDRKTENFVNNTKKSLLLLNDDCLLQIFSFFNIFQLIHLETVCIRFFNLINTTCYKRYQVVNINKIIINTNTTLMEKRSVLIRIGKYIKQMTINDCECDHAERIFNMIPKFCKNLEILKFFNFTSFDQTHLLSKYFPILKRLKVLFIWSSNVTDEVLMKLFTKTDSLVKLNLYNNPHINGEFLIKLKNFTFLNISFCDKIQPEYFSEFCNNNKTLKYLNIAYSSKLNGRNIEEICQNFVHLEHLSISNFYDSCKKSDYSKFGNLPNLKKFEIYFINNTQINLCDLFKEFAKRDQLETIGIYDNIMLKKFIVPITKLTKLKEIIICDNDYITDNDLSRIVSKGILKCLKIICCHNITDAGILKSIALCPDLEFLNVYNCIQVDKDFILALPKVLLLLQKKISLKVSTQLTEPTIVMKI